jgi:hypothetical protein
VAFVVQLTWEGVTPEQYDEARDKVGWETDLAKGGVFHVAWFEGGALHACDVWEKPEDFEAFVQERLLPVTKGEMNVAGEPTVEVREAHRYLDTVHGEARS